MESNKSKIIIAQFLSGIFGGTILGVAGLVTLMNYGGNVGCWVFAGYESCGLFGAIVGLIVGAVAGVAVLPIFTITNYSRAAMYLLLGSFVLPFVYGLILFWPSIESSFFIVPPVVGVFMIASSVPSAIIVGILHLLQRLRMTRID